MPVSPEQAQAELDRRAGLSPVTPDMARAELERRGMGVPQVPGAVAPQPAQQRREEFGRQEETALGRIGGAFAEPFRETQFGIPEEAAQLFQSPESAFNTFNELVVRGVASPAFTILQGLGAGAEGVIDALAQSAVEVGGVSPDIAQRSARDVKGLLESAPAFVAAAPLALTRAGGAATQVGGAAAPITGAIRRAPVTQKVAGQIQNFAVARRAKKSVPKAEVRAFRTIRRALAKDLGNKGRAEAALRKWVADGADPDALIDLGGENMKRLARSLASEEPEKALNIITRFREAQPTEIRGALQRAANQRGLFAEDVLDDIKFIKETKGSEKYRAIESVRIPQDTPGVYPLLRSTLGKQAIRQARKIADFDDDREMVGVLDQLLKGKEPPLSIRAIQLIKEEGFDDIIGRVKRGGGKTGRMIKRKNNWLTVIDNTIPEYKAARDFYAGQFDTEEALQLGREFMKGNKTAIQVRRELTELNPSEREFYRLGVADAMEGVISRTRDASNKATFVKTDAMRNKIKALLGEDPESADEFIDFLQKSSERFERRAAISPRVGSQTEERLRGAGLLRAALSPREAAIRGVSALEAGRERKVTEILTDAFFVGRPLRSPADIAAEAQR